MVIRDNVFGKDDWIEEGYCEYGMKVKLSKDVKEAEQQLHELNYYERTRLEKTFNEADFCSIAKKYAGQEIEF